MIEFEKIIVILDERISDEDRKALLETPPPGLDGESGPKVIAGHSDLFPTAMMYLVEVGVANGKEWLRAYRERGLTAFPYSTPKLLTAVRDKMKRRFQP